MVRMLFRLACLTVVGATAAVAAEPRPEPTLPTPSQLFRMLQSDPEIPEEMAGVWSITVETSNCGGPVFNTITESDTLCAGDLYDPSDEEQPVQCTGTISGNSVDITCSGMFDVFEGCSATLTVDSEGTFSTDAYSITSTVDIVYTGSGEGCDQLPDSCIQNTVTATRTGPAPSSCQTPVQPTTWSGIKTQFR